jgi:hypothetical protein
MSDYKEIQSAVEQLGKSLAALGGKKEDGPSKDEKIALLKSIATDADARKAYAASRAGVILPTIPFQSTVRSIFKQEVLAPGAQSSYPVNFDYTEVASYMPKLGGVATRILEGTEIFIPTFGIQAAVRYPMDVAEQGRLDIAEGATGELKSRIIAAEERAGWALITGTLASVNTAQTVYCSGSTAFGFFSKAAMNKMMIQMDKQRRELTDVYASPQSIGDVRDWTQTQVDFLTQREIFQAGGLPGGQIWNVGLHKVYSSALVGDTDAYGFDVKTFGKMPIRKELVTYEDPLAITNWEIGIMGRELVGFGITDSWAVVNLKMNSTHTAVSCS